MHETLQNRITYGVQSSLQCPKCHRTTTQQRNKSPTPSDTAEQTPTLRNIERTHNRTDCVHGISPPSGYNWDMCEECNTSLVYEQRWIRSLTAVDTVSDTAMVRSLTLPWYGLWHCHGTVSDTAMVWSLTLPWYGLWHCHGKHLTSLVAKSKRESSAVCWCRHLWEWRHAAERCSR